MLCGPNVYWMKIQVNCAGIKNLHYLCPNNNSKVFANSKYLMSQICLLSCLFSKSCVI